MEKGIIGLHGPNTFGLAYVLQTIIGDLVARQPDAEEILRRAGLVVDELETLATSALIDGDVERFDSMNTAKDAALVTLEHIAEVVRGPR
jgi:hypothetical protein